MNPTAALSMDNLSIVCSELGSEHAHYPESMTVHSVNSDVLVQSHIAWTVVCKMEHRRPMPSGMTRLLASTYLPTHIAG